MAIITINIIAITATIAVIVEPSKIAFDSLESIVLVIVIIVNSYHIIN